MQVEPSRSELAVFTDGAMELALLRDMSGVDPVGERAAIELIRRARVDYLNALPIAAAIVTQKPDGAIELLANERFEMLDSLSGIIPIRPGAAAPLIEREPLKRALQTFLAGDKRGHEFGWQDGDGVGGRHFVVRLGRLSAYDDGTRRCVLSLIDRTAEVENERSLRAEMTHDSLTGLPNRVAFGEALDAVLACDDPVGHAVLIVDLTRFSRINESMGSIAGDELIITVARRMVASLRAGDMLARIGGDEFAILLTLTDGPGDALHAARRIQATMTAPFRISDLEIRIDCAIGCALVSDRAAGAEDLVRNAQFALKRAKASGRVEVYQPGEVSKARHRFSLETELRRAIDSDSLTLAFQPLINLQTNRVAGFEALARWEHEALGLISPTEFIPVAEESGLIVPLGRWAFETALSTLAQWDATQGEAVPIHIGVNVSAIQLARDDVSSAVEGALRRAGITGERLTLELTESSIVQDPERATRTLQGLKELDAKIAMDDFGTGYSSLAYLQRLPIDILKIDRSFVTGMLGDRDSVAIVRAVLGLADALGMDTTAEGVETFELAQTLAALGCSCGQGFYFARPLAADEALAYWRSRNA
ncbi:putative bifunctional diguanylate cyclase/phosphodiesterase [Edaphosphingomonas fennica]|uniref:Bifunctional diguanylate cyclase/phosphodiesterase n=2 Tax=Edaphosphingomonas TaxID=3423724 RepID=A0A2T4I5P7_9SPHN|nr:MULTISPECIES: bifunctional diguanylate cyclase/phosphodiesterase [Sphingomonas]MDX3884854.1 bifunctional diguanylate cyclase/phosphodiesterase [Sphingomonas sp.]OHT19179.1 Phytochrome-like protein cph2 [Sphingomonas haloaromaticamans]PTD25654.1 bifunctional diguanylate cyclase/phosphodiesterase [Sphingomonas fennica]